MSYKTPLILIFIVLFFIGFKVWESDWFQKEYFPKEYWTKQVKSLQDNVDFNRTMIIDTQIELKKIASTAKLELAQAINMAKSSGMDVETMRKDTVEAIKMEIEVLQEMLLEYKTTLKDNEQQLKNAQLQLSHYRL